jgi:iron complex outermembrane recepter protein
LKPEQLDSVEVGVKNTLMDGRAVINVALFQNQYKDQLYAFTDPVTFRFVDGNVGKSKLNGVDLTGAFVAGGLRVDGAVSYLDGKITAVDPGVTDVAVGNKPVLAPKLSASLGVSYRFPMLGGELSLGGEYTFKDEMFQDLQNTILRPSVELVNLNAAWKAPGGKWRLFASVNNALDKEYLERPANALGGAPTPVFAGAPRKIKLGAAINF